MGTTIKSKDNLFHQNFLHAPSPKPTNFASSQENTPPPAEKNHADVVNALEGNEIFQRLDKAEQAAVFLLYVLTKMEHIKLDSHLEEKPEHLKELKDIFKKSGQKKRDFIASQQTVSRLETYSEAVKPLARIITAAQAALVFTGYFPNGSKGIAGIQVAGNLAAVLPKFKGVFGETKVKKMIEMLENPRVKWGIECVIVAASLAQLYFTGPANLAFNGGKILGILQTAAQASQIGLTIFTEKKRAEVTAQGKELESHQHRHDLRVDQLKEKIIKGFKMTDLTKVAESLSENNKLLQDILGNMMSATPA